MCGINFRKKTRKGEKGLFFAKESGSDLQKMQNNFEIYLIFVSIRYMPCFIS